MNLSRREILILLGIFLLGLIPRLWRLPYDLQVNRDQGMHAQAIWNIWYEGRISLLGHSTDADGIWHGPLFYWLMTPSFFVGKGDPAVAGVFQAVLAQAGVFFLWLLARQLFGPKTALVSSLLYSISYGLSSSARWLSNVTPVLPLSLVFTWCLYQVFCRRPRFLPAAAFLASLIAELHGAIGLYLYFALAVIFFLSHSFRHLNRRLIVISALAFLLPHSPLVLFELRHDFVISKSVIGLGQSASAGLGLSLPVIIYNWRILFAELVNLASFPYSWIAAMLAALSLFLVIIRRSPPYQFLLLYIGTFFLATCLFRRGAIGFFFFPLLPLFLVLFSQGLALLPRLLSVPLLLFIIGLNFYHWTNFLTPHLALTPVGTSNLITHQDRKNLVDWLYHQTSGQAFAVWIYTIPYFQDDAWNYYFTWYAGSRYGYYPEATSGFSPGELKTSRYFFNLYEPDDDQPGRLSSWLQLVEQNFGPVISQYHSDDAIVEQRAFVR